MKITFIKNPHRTAGALRESYCEIRAVKLLIKDSSYFISVMKVLFRMFYDVDLKSDKNWNFST
jgi:hypothetical protein